MSPKVFDELAEKAHQADITAAILRADSYTLSLDEQIGYLLGEGVSVSTVDGWYSQIRAAIDHLIEMPRLYPVDEFQTEAVGVETRKITAGDYLVFYQVDDGDRLVLLVAFVHGATRAQGLIPEASHVEHVGQGGQKQVFKADLNGTTYAVKFCSLPRNEEDDEDPGVEAEARLQREIEIMRKCDSDHMVRLGPIDLTITQHGDERLIYFAEEYIVGKDLAACLKDGVFEPEETVRLGLEISDAIRSLWSLDKIHRDIKPQNIMRRDRDGSFVLLDAGFAFDLHGESLSQGLFVGTMAYSPIEQFDYSRRRTSLDFRLDMYSLGVTMYHMVTGIHPFRGPGDRSQTMLANIRNGKPAKPSSHNGKVSKELDTTILRMMGRSPHQRFRTIDMLTESLRKAGGA
ncbi:unnamed protein product [Ostreobium quekettii]|nr:unnamed protein product [Ostreobium quekettii]